MIEALNATYAIRRENSLFCPKRNPISHARLFSSLCLPSKNLNTIGLTISIAIAKIIAAIATSGKNLRLNKLSKRLVDELEEILLKTEMRKRI